MLVDVGWCWWLVDTIESDRCTLTDLKRYPNVDSVSILTTQPWRQGFSSPAANGPERLKGSRLSPRLLVPSTCYCTCVARTCLIFQPSAVNWQKFDQLAVPCPLKDLFLGSVVPVQTSAWCHLQECSCSTVGFGALRRLSGGHMDYLDPFCSAYHAAPKPWCSPNTILQHLYHHAPRALPFSNKIFRICLVMFLWPITVYGDWEGCN